MDRPVPSDGEKVGPGRCHCLNKKSAIEVQVSCLAARFGNQQTTMAGGPVQGAIVDPACRIMVGANRITEAHQ